VTFDLTKVAQAVRSLPMGKPFTYRDVEAQLDRMGLEVKGRVELQIPRVRGVRREVRGLDRRGREPKVNIYTWGRTRQATRAAEVREAKKVRA
jgi:hypothetical protein